MPGKFICQTPFDECSGQEITFDQKSKALKLTKRLKTHGSGQESNDCQSAYLQSQGYTQGRNREFHKEGSPTITIPKVSRQPDLRDGKSWKGTGRVMPAKSTSGVIVG